MATRESALPSTASILPVWLRNRWGVAAGVAVAYLFLYMAWTYFRWGGPENQVLLSDLAYLPLSLFAAVAEWRVASDTSLGTKVRRAWFILGCASFANFFGDLLWFYLEGVLLVSPFPSIADFFYLLFYPLALIGLLMLPGAPISRGERIKFVLDMAIVMTVAGMVVWYFVIGPTAGAASDDSLMLQILAAAYPVGDLVALSGIVWLLLRRLEPALRSALVLYMAGLLFFVFADLAYAYQSLVGTYASGGWLDVVWLVAFILLALAALRQRYAPKVPIREGWSARTLEVFPLALPFVAILVGYGLVIFVLNFAFDLGVPVRGLFISAALLTLLVVGRQFVTLRENMQLNAELRAFSAQLERRVEERTRELQQSQEALLASQKLASTGALASGIVHEVSNPLNTIAAAAEALQMHIDSEDAVDAEILKEYMPVISRSVWHAARIVQSLRSFSRGGQPELVPQDLAQVIDDALFLMAYQIERWQDVRVVTEFEPGLPAVMCDRNQIAQVVINLLNNARDAMPGGGPIALRLKRSSAGAVIEVQDQGVGITPEQEEKIFTPFYTTKTIGKGSGLGLSIVSAIVRAHQGTVTAHSDGTGKGATFVVTLPFAQQS